MGRDGGGGVGEELEGSDSGSLSESGVSCRE